MRWPDRQRRRTIIGAAILVAWAVALVLLVRRTYFRPQLERLAEGASRVAPGAVYYAVMQGDKQVGFASSMIDTTDTGFLVEDYLVADVPVGDSVRRTTSKTSVQLSRTLRMRTFDYSFEGENGPVTTSGRVDGDSILVLSNSAADTQRIALSGPVFLPSLVPITAAVIDPPKVGRGYDIPVFDPSQRSQRVVHLGVSAESLVVVHDSATFDSTTGRWNGVLPATINTWRLAADSSNEFTGWVDEHGRAVETSRLGFVLKRLPYEVAFVNWRNDSTRVKAGKDPDIPKIRQTGRPKR